MPRSWRPRRRSSASFRAASSACRSTPTATPRSGWRCRRASSTSDARRRRPTSARRRSCSRSWPGRTPCTTGRRGCGASPSACASSPARSTAGLGLLGHELLTDVFFDTIRVRPDGDAGAVIARALASGINLRDFKDGTLGIALDEATRPEDLDDLFSAFNEGVAPDFSARSLAARGPAPALPVVGAADVAVPRAPGLPPLPLRDRDASVPAPARVPRPVAQHEHDPARLVHDEAERDDGDGRA